MISILKKNQIRLEESPYTFVRTTVMRTLLIPKSDYQKLLKMSLPEISNYLSETQYRKEINELGVKFAGIELIEHALNKNFIYTMEKLKRISPDSYKRVIEIYLLKYDIDNLKTIIRGKKANLTDAEIRELLLPVGKFSMQNLEQCMKKESVEDILKVLGGFDFKKTKLNNLMNIETSLDHFYFREVLKFADRIPRQGDLFKEFLLSMIHATNLLTFLRLKKEKLNRIEIEKHIFFTNDNVSNLLLRQLLKASSDDEIYKILQKSRYRNIFASKNLLQRSLIPTEIALQNYVLKKTMLFEHQNPLSVYVILGYMFAKEIEIKNLKRIIKAKHLGINMETVAQQLVLA